MDEEENSFINLMRLFGRGGREMDLERIERGRGACHMIVHEASVASEQGFVTLRMIWFSPVHT